MINRAGENAATVSQLKRMAGFFEVFKAHRWRGREARLVAMRDFISAFHARAEQWRAARPAQFNALSLFKVGTDEVMHSAFLAWLLDTEESHRQGSLFLRAFLNACRPRPLIAIPDRYQVQTEFSGPASIVDILVHRAKQLILYIENKTVSPDMPGQLDRELSDMRRLGDQIDVPPDSQIAVYLTPEGRKPHGEHAKEWRTAAYRDVRAAFDRALPLVTDDKVRFLVDDWLDTIQIFAGAWRQRMTKQFSEESMLVAQNWDTVLDILRAKERLDKELSGLLLSVEAELEGFGWQAEGWVFRPVPKDGSQIYIANENWMSGGGFAVWMGVHRFTSEHVLGSETPPQFYVRAAERFKDLGHTLAKEIAKTGKKVVTGDWYFIGRDIQKCLMDEKSVMEYPDAVRKQIAELFDFHVKLLMRFDDVIKQYLAGKEEAAA